MLGPAPTGLTRSTDAHSIHPSPRTPHTHHPGGHAAAMLGSTQMLVFGGFDGTDFLGDTWIFDLDKVRHPFGPLLTRFSNIYQRCTTPTRAV